MESRPISQLESTKPLNLAERIALLDRAPATQPDIHRSEEYQRPSISTSTESSISSPQNQNIRAEYLLALSEIDEWLAIGKIQRRTSGEESTATDQHDADQDDDAPLPRQGHEVARSRRKIIPRNSRHDRELVRNRTAAMKYRERRKAQVDLLVRKAQHQQNLLVVQRQLVSSLQEEVQLLKQAYLTTVEMVVPTAGRCGPCIKDEVI